MSCALRINGMAARLPKRAVDGEEKRRGIVAGDVAPHAMNGNCWINAYPCDKGCTSVCDRCHEHNQLRAACPVCEACPWCGRSET
jgi:hypothetical protein